MGNAKNAGKTTVLNALVRAHPDVTLGLSSIGLDGEQLDTVSFLPKPRVHVPAGTLVATARDCVKQSDAVLQELEELDIRTGLGSIVVACVTKPGNVLLGGPSTTQGMENALASMGRHGAQKLLIDGAFARQSHAATTQALVYVGGAHRSPDMQQVVRSAGLALKRMALPEAPEEARFLLEEQRLGWLDDSADFHPLDVHTSLGQAEKLLDSLPASARWLYVPGAVTDGLAQRLVERRAEHRAGLILQSPLSLVVEDAVLRRLFRLNRPIVVLRPMTTAFVAYNPCSPAGHRFDSQAFREALAQQTSLPLINVAEEDSI